MSVPIKENSRDFLVKINDVYKRISRHDIYYFKSDGKYVKLAVDEHEYLIKYRLKNLIEILPGNFKRSHTSYIVNVDKVSSFIASSNKLILDNSVEIPLSRSYKEDIISSFLIG